MSSAQSFDEAQKTLKANLGPRYERLNLLEAFVDGTAYDGRKDFFDRTVPMLERAPCVQYPLVAIAIGSHSDLCLGEGRWPTVTSRPDEDDSDFDPDYGLNEDDSVTLDRGITAICKQARLKTAARELLESAMSCGTHVAIVCIRNGKLAVEITKAKWCTPQWDPLRPCELTSLEIRYPYIEEHKDDRTGQVGSRCLLYRRVIDAQNDTTFIPAVAAESGAEPKTWTPDTAKTVEHKFGFCPARWYKFLPKTSTVANDDGIAIHATRLKHVEALDFAISQRHRAALYAGEPQLIETGVDTDDATMPMGRVSNIVLANDPANPGAGGWSTQNTGGKPARRRGPGEVWSYKNPETKVDILSLPGDALKASDDNARDIRGKLCEALHYVHIDPDNAKFSAELSGKALERLYDRQIRYIDKVRESFGDEGLLPLIDTILRVLATVKADGLRLPGVKKLQPILQKFFVEQRQADNTVTREWMPPELTLKWGAYFTPTETDEATAQKMAADGLIAKIITKRMAVERIAPFYGVENVDQVIEALEAEEQKEHDLMHAANAALGELLPPAGAAPTHPEPAQFQRPGQSEPPPAQAAAA